MALSTRTSSSVTFSESSTALRSSEFGVISGFGIYANTPGLFERLPDKEPTSLSPVRMTKTPR